MLNETLNLTNQTSLKEQRPYSFLFQSLGIFFGIFSGFVYASAGILIKKLSAKKNHFSIINLYAAYFGIPMSLACAIIADEVGMDNKDWTVISDPSFKYEVTYSVASSILGVCSHTV